MTQNKYTYKKKVSRRNPVDYLQLPAVPHDLVEVVWTLERYRHPVAVLDGEKSKAVNGSYAFRSLNLSKSITAHHRNIHYNLRGEKS